MAKKSKIRQAESIPTIYHDLRRDAALQHNTICEDVHHGFYMFSTPQENHILKDAQHKVWAKFDQFANENKQTILAYHADLFKAEPPKDQELITTALYCWFKLAMISIDRTVKTPVTAEGRKSMISNRKYLRGEEFAKGVSLIKTPQAMACFRIFSDLIAAQEAKDVEGMPSSVRATYTPMVSEADLKAAIENRAAEIRTRQDPWRIFQYYRPTLNQSKLIIWRD